MAYRPKPDVRAAILRAIEAGCRRMGAIYKHVQTAPYNDVRFSGWSWIDLELYRMKRDGLVYYAQRSPGVQPGWYILPQDRYYGDDANLTKLAMELQA